MLHLLDGFLVLVFGEPLESPALPHAGMQEILVDGREFVFQNAVELLDDLPVALHDPSPLPMRCSAASRHTPRPTEAQGNWVKLGIIHNDIFRTGDSISARCRIMRSFSTSSIPLPIQAVAMRMVPTMAQA